MKKKSRIYRYLPLSLAFIWGVVLIAAVIVSDGNSAWLVISSGSSVLITYLIFYLNYKKDENQFLEQTRLQMLPMINVKATAIEANAQINIQSIFSNIGLSTATNIEVSDSSKHEVIFLGHLPVGEQNTTNILLSNTPVLSSISFTISFDDMQSRHYTQSLKFLKFGNSYSIEITVPTLVDQS